jgi:prolipoprotein diacylglyceryltransferase
VGGLIGGAVIGLIFVQTRSRNQRVLQLVLLGAFAAVLVGLSLTKLFV